MKNLSLLAIAPLLLVLSVTGDDIILYRSSSGIRQANLANGQDRAVLFFERADESFADAVYCGGYVWLSAYVLPDTQTNDELDESRLYRFQLDRNWGKKLDIDPEVWMGTNDNFLLDLACLNGKYIVYSKGPDPYAGFDVVGCDSTEDYDESKCVSPNLDVDDTANYEEIVFDIQADSRFVYVSLWIDQITITRQRHRRGEGVEGLQHWKWNPETDEFTRIARVFDGNSNTDSQGPPVVFEGSLSPNWLWIAGIGTDYRVNLEDGTLEILTVSVDDADFDPISWSVIAYSDTVFYRLDGYGQKVAKCVEGSTEWVCEVVYDFGVSEWIEGIDVIWTGSSVSNTIQVCGYAIMAGLVGLINA